MSPLLSPLDVLLPYQHKWVDDSSRFKMWLASRQIGKSFGCAAEAVRDCLAKPGDSWVILSAGERQALEFMEKARQWAKAFKLVVENYTEDRDSAEALIKSAEIRWRNGSRMLALPANPNTARGYSANLILDEFAFHENPDLIWRGIFPSISNQLAGKFKLRIVSTANGKNNKFYSLWDRQNNYSKHRVTIHDAVAQGLCGNADPVAFIEELKSGLDDDEGWAQEFECEFLDGSNVLLPYDVIALAESADASEFDTRDPHRTPGTRYCGIDFGRSSDPTVCWTLEKIGDVLWTREVVVLKNTGTAEQNQILASRIAAAQLTCVDCTGPGIGFGDYAVRDFTEYKPALHKFGKVELCNFSVNFKRELFPKLRRAFEAPTMLRIPISRAVREDLHAVQQIVQNGQYSYWAPRGKEGHSDRCTALALAVRAAGDSVPFAYQGLKTQRGQTKINHLNRRILV